MQDMAIEIEMLIRNIYKCDRGDVCGIADSDFIRSYPVMSLICCISYMSVNNDANEENGKKFINKYIDKINFSLEEITKNDIENIIKDFNNINIRSID